MQDLWDWNWTNDAISQGCIVSKHRGVITSCGYIPSWSVQTECSPVTYVGHLSFPCCFLLLISGLLCSTHVQTGVQITNTYVCAKRQWLYCAHTYWCICSICFNIVSPTMTLLHRSVCRSKVLHLSLQHFCIIN